MTSRLRRSCKRSCNCTQLLTQLQLLSATANVISSHLTAATATASHIKPATATTTANTAHKSFTAATASANGGFRSGTTAITTANDGFRQPQLQQQLQLHTLASQLHATATARIKQMAYSHLKYSLDPVWICVQIQFAVLRSLAVQFLI